MTRRIVIAALAPICFLSTALAEDHFAGTWKARNGPGTVTVETVDNGLRHRVSGVRAQDEWTAHLDGKEYPTTSGRFVTLKKIDDNTYEYAVSPKDHSITVTNRVVHSQDGKTRTTTRTSSNGQQSSTSVFDKQ